MSNVLNKFKLGETLIDIEDLKAQEALKKLAVVAKTGNYNDLTNKPTIPPSITIDTSLSSTSTNPVENRAITNKIKAFSNVAITGSYSDLTNKPTITYDSTEKTITFSGF